jgi:hypothetical protein
MGCEIRDVGARKVEVGKSVNDEKRESQGEDRNDPHVVKPNGAGEDHR